MTSDLRALAELILQNVDILEGDCAKRGVKIPSLDDPYVYGPDVINESPAAAGAFNTLNSAAAQLLATVRPLPTNLFAPVTGFVTAAALRTATELHIAEILSEAGTDGLHINEIASQSNTDPKKLGGVLRALASQWIFKEVKPDVFANSRLSSALHKGQSLKDLQTNPAGKYDKPQAVFAATVGHIYDEGAKSLAYLYEALADPKTAFSTDATDTAFNKAFNTTKNSWEFFEEPEQKERLYRFGVAMEGASKLEPSGLAAKLFDWDDLKDGSVVVDVGGGVGTASIQVAKAFSKLQFIVQDRHQPIADGKKRLETNEKALHEAKRITYQEHDFFATQPVKNASVFFMKHILHDWSDPYCVDILRRLRAAATPETRLFIMDKIPPYVCPPSAYSDSDIGIPGVIKPQLVSPLNNVAGGNIFSFVSNLIMLGLLQGQERTIGHTVALYREAGWKVVKVKQLEPLGQIPSGIHAIPI